jgi:DNA-binding GntR family transcriptional regulator
MESDPLSNPSPTPLSLADARLTPIEQVPLKVQIAEMLRAAIVSGRMRPGTVLVETALAEQMNVSRAPIREAVQILESDGLVETVPYKGKWVKPLTEREITETYEMREVFEAMAVRRLLARPVPLAPLWEACAAMEAAARADDREALIAADDRFHRSLIRLADHELLAQTWAGIYLRVHQIMALRNDRRVPLADIAANHPPIVRAIEAREADLAVRLISEHTRALGDLDAAAIAGFFP